MQVEFVRRVLTTLLRSGELHRDDSILSVCADPRDGRLFSSMDFANVTLSNLTNLDERVALTDEFGYPWRREDAQDLSLPDGSFDVVFVSAGLHHCQWPHRALAEMYRVARKMVVVVESRESVLMRLALGLGWVRQYEINQTLATTLRLGGMNGGPIPNFVYRWTEREFVKTISCLDPTGKQRFAFFYDYSLKRRIHPLLDPFIRVALRLLKVLLPRQGNCFGMVAFPPRSEDLWPWLSVTDDGVCLNEEYVRGLRRLPAD